MALDLTIGEIVQVLTTIVAAVAVIVTTRNDTKWIRELLTRHEIEDDRRFKDLHQSIRDQRFFSGNEG